jgi:hypothetical protein
MQLSKYLYLKVLMFVYKTQNRKIYGLLSTVRNSKQLSNLITITILDTLHRPVFFL